MYFAIFTHVPHQEQEGRFFAYSPYVREMNLWLKHVEKVEIVAPLSKELGTEGVIKTKGLPYQHLNLCFSVIPSFDLLNIISIFKALFRIPKVFYQIYKTMRRADHLHLRCPGNIGLLACICQVFFPGKPKTAKYAGNWDPKSKQPWTYNFQKWILSNRYLTRNMQILAYGKWPNQTDNFVSFFTASFNKEDKGLIKKKPTSPYKFIFVGNLVEGKQPAYSFALIQALKRNNISAELHIYGEGPLKNDLESQAENKEYIYLHGNQPLEVLKQAYIEAHFLILASQSEGWPKAVAEAMFFGCIPIATAVSCVPWMLAAPPAPEGGANNVIVTNRGILIPVNEKRKYKKVKKSVVEPVRRGGSGKWKVESLDGLDKVNRRKGTADNPRVLKKRGSTANTEQEDQSVLDETVDKIIELIKNPEKMKRMSREAQEWSQEYTLEKFEEAIKEILTPWPSKG